VDQKGYYTCYWLRVRMEGRGLYTDKNWPAGDNMIIDPYMSAGWIPLHNITTIISVASKTFKNAQRRRIMNLFWMLKLSWTCSNSTSLPTPHPWNKVRVKPPSVQTSRAHASYTQQFHSVNISNRSAQCQISWPATARKQWDPHA